MVIRTMTGAGFGTGGQHADYLEAWFAHTAGIKVVAPSNPADAYGLMLSCIFDDDPCLFIENMPTYWNPGRRRLPASAFRSARRTSCVEAATSRSSATAAPVDDCAAVADKLGKEGITVEVIDLRTIAPYDAETVLNSVARTKRAVIVHEAVKPFGVGAEIAARINEELFGQLKSPVERVGANFSPVPFSKPLETELRTARRRASKPPSAAPCAEPTEETHKMSTEVLLPKIGFSMNEGMLTRWLVEDGATVTQGQPLYELESEKSVQEVEAPASGTLKIVVDAVGETYPVGTVLGHIG